VGNKQLFVNGNERQSSRERMNGACSVNYEGVNSLNTFYSSYTTAVCNLRLGMLLLQLLQQLFGLTACGNAALPLTLLDDN
jgi:hypothetical protein